MPIVSLPVPASAGVGASQDVSALGKDKTIIVGAESAFTGLVIVETSLDGVVWAPLMALGRADYMQIQVVSQYMRARADGALFVGTGVTAHVGAAEGTNQFVEIPLPAAGSGLGTPVSISALGSFQTYQTKMTTSVEEGTLSILARGNGTAGFVPVSTFKRGGYFNLKGFSAAEVRSYGRGFTNAASLTGYTLYVGAQDD